MDLSHSYTYATHAHEIGTCQDFDFEMFEITTNLAIPTTCINAFVLQIIIGSICRSVQS